MQVNLSRMVHPAEQRRLQEEVRALREEVRALESEVEESRAGEAAAVRRAAVAEEELRKTQVCTCGVTGSKVHPSSFAA